MNPLETNEPAAALPDVIPAILPRGAGHQFLLYGDACSGVPGALHEETFASVNAVVSRLRPQPEFILFPGDEIIGLTTDEQALRAQWHHWLDVEMAWLDRSAIPLYHSTGNHTTFDPMSERLFADVLDYLPRNGPPGQVGLSYFIRRGDLLLVFVHTLWSDLGGEGHVETAWLAETLQAHVDARHKLVIGHHPVFPVNGFAGEYQREIGAEYTHRFWQILVENGVLAYLCSHILAFDVQVDHGVLQLLTAGAGTAHRMPDDVEYLHCVQAALDEQGLRYQVLDQSGSVRERLTWPPVLAVSQNWVPLPMGEQDAGFRGNLTAVDGADPLLAWRFSGRPGSLSQGKAQTLLAAWSQDAALAAVWIGLTGATQRLTVIIGSAPGRSPHYWFGPSFDPTQPFDFELAIHAGMGPGGILWRKKEGSPWSSLRSASSWGAERILWPSRWSLGFGKGGHTDSPFRGLGLSVLLYRPGASRQD